MGINEQIKLATSKTELSLARSEGGGQMYASAKTLRKRARLVKAKERALEK